MKRTALRQKRNYDVRAKSKPEFKPGDLVRYFYVREKAGNKFHRCFIGPYVVISRESDMNYNIFGKLRDSGKEDIRIVHADHLISYEPDRDALFPRYGAGVHIETNSAIQAPTIAESIEKYDIFAHSSSGDEVNLVDPPTSPLALSVASTCSPDGPPAVSGEKSKEEHSSLSFSSLRNHPGPPERRWPHRTRKKPDRFKYL